MLFVLYSRQAYTPKPPNTKLVIELFACCLYLTPRLYKYTQSCDLKALFVLIVPARFSTRPRPDAPTLKRRCRFWQAKTAPPPS